MSTISVVIPTYNSADCIGQAIRSVIAQTRKADEIIVVDDGSKDNTEAILAHWIADGTIKCFHQENRGPGAARNRGISEATSEYVCFLDSDDTLMPSSIDVRAQFLDEHSEVGMVFSDLLQLSSADGERTTILRSESFLRIFMPALEWSAPPYYVYGDRYLEYAIIHHPFIFTPTVMVRRRIFDEVGFFNTRLKASEDIEMWFRIGRHHGIGFVDLPLAEWHRYRSRLSRSNPAFYTDTVTFYRSLLDSGRFSGRVKRALRRRIGEYLCDHAYCCARNEDWRETRRKSAESLRWNPFSLTATRLLVLSLLPRSLHRLLRLVKRSPSEGE